MRDLPVAILGRGDRLEGPGEWAQFQGLGSVQWLAARAMDMEADMVAVAVAMTIVAVERGASSHKQLGTPAKFASFRTCSRSPSVRTLLQNLQPIAECEDNDRKTSIIMVDTRDDRVVSPFHAWLVREIMTNSSNSINVFTERDQVMPPRSDFHLSLFANYTLDGVKAAVAKKSVDSQQELPVAAGIEPQPMLSVTWLFSTFRGRSRT